MGETDFPTLRQLTVDQLSSRLASRDPVPGGGSASALTGALAAALVGMVGELTAGRPDAAAHEGVITDLRTRAGMQVEDLLRLADEDAAAYAQVVSARHLPRETDGERAIRRATLDAAMVTAAEVPLATAEAAAEVLRLAERIAPIGNPNAVSDAGVAAELASAAILGAALNVRINLPYLPAGAELRESAGRRLDELQEEAATSLQAVRATVSERIPPS